MKAGVVANLAAARAIRDSGVRLRKGLALHLVIGEEDGGLGAFGTLARGHTGEACIITEPTSGHVDLFGRKAEQPARLDALQAHGHVLGIDVGAEERHREQRPPEQEDDVDITFEDAAFHDAMRAREPSDSPAAATTS